MDIDKRFKTLSNVFSVPPKGEGVQRDEGGEGKG